MDENPHHQYYERGFLLALTEAIASEDEKQREAAENCIINMYAAFRGAMGPEANCTKFPAFHILANYFCSNCYEQEPTRKNGGCLGISFLCSKLDLGSVWMMEHQIDFVKALLFVLKDSSPSISSCNLEEAVQTFHHVLKVSNRHDEDSSPERQAKFSGLISILIAELSNSNSMVRETIQSSFQLLADLTGNEVTEILTPVRDRLLAPIFAKPLRALPFAMQMGHVDAVTYCLSLRPPLLSFSDELVRLISEALALADAEDQTLISKSSQYKNATSLTIFRVLCIKLLSAAMTNSEFMQPEQATTRSRIISVFFKSLYSKSNEVVEVSYKGEIFLLFEAKDLY
jgi:transformation/transcription domain-associated protein